MCNDTSDDSDVDPCSSVQRNHCNRINRKQNRTIFNDSCFDQLNQDDRKCVSVSGGSTSSNSLSQCQRLQNVTNTTKNLPNNVNSDYACRCCHDNDDSDTSSSDSQIIVNRKRKFSRRGSSAQELAAVINLADDDDDRMNQNYFHLQSSEDSNYTTDSSSNELVEKCPICLLTFRNQEIGSPSTCQHLFCAKCIEEWSKNVRTCPIDRIEFSSIIVYESYENLKVIREINVTSDLINAAPIENIIGIENLLRGDDVTNCVICNGSDREEVMLLCDQCDRGYHMDCLTPPLLRIPPDDWFCDECTTSRNVNEDISISNMLQRPIIVNVDLDQTNNSDSVSLGRYQQPRILRTRQNERIRLSILRRTEEINSRSVLTNNNSAQVKSLRRKPKRKHRRRVKKRIYVKEYGLNDFNEKFAIKTIKRSTRRRKTRKRSVRKPKSNLNIMKKSVNMTSSKRLAEQLGIKSNSNYTSLIRNSTSLSLFGSKYDLEYFSDNDDDPNMASEIRIDNGNGTAALQTSALITNFRPQRAHKSILVERPQSYSHPNQGNDYLNGDLLSTIMDIQERWHNAAQNLQNVRINSDGSLNLLQTENHRKIEDNTNKQNVNLSLPNQADFNHENKGRLQNTPNNNDIMEAPMYSRGGGGGGNASFNGGGGDYSNRYNGNNQNYRGGGGSGNHYRHSNNGNTGSNSSYNMIGRGNFNFSNTSNYNSTHQNQNIPFSPFSIRFNPRNQLNNQRNNQRNSIPTLNNSNNRSGTTSMQRQINLNNPFNSGMPINIPPPTQSIQRLLQQNQNITNDCNNLFAGLPPPIRGTESTNNVITPTTVAYPSGVLLSVPPPPAPPPAMSSLNLHNATTSYSHNLSCHNDDDNSNCPNFAVYSQESLAVAKSVDIVLAPNSNNESKEDDDMNEDLIQLDDDDEDIPMPPEPTSTATITAAATANVANLQNVELYEPENPTDELDDDDVNDTIASNEQITNEKQRVSDDDGHDDKHSVKSEKSTTFKSDLRQSDDLDDGNRENASDQINSDIKINDNNFSNINDNNNLSEENCSKEAYRNKNPLITPATHSPLSTNLEFRQNESEASNSNRKGVLELYDDSDWEELNIDRPEGYVNTTAHAEEKPPISPVNFVCDKERNNCEEDRSYTPCLDEHNDIETDNMETPNVVFNDGDLNTANAVVITEKNDEKHQENVVADMNTELISEDDDNGNHRDKVRWKGKHTVNEKSNKDNIETFKKVSGKQKERNYRGDKQQHSKRSQRKYRSRSPIRSRSRSSTSNRSRIKLRSRSRCRSRTKSRSPRQRGRDKQRSRSNNKENYSRWRSGSQRDRCKGSERRVKNQQRNKRRELPRYDVRNVIGYNSRRPVKDRYGRDTSRSRKSSFSPSRSRKIHPCRSSYSRSRSHSHSRSRSRSRSASLRSRSISFHEKRNRRLSISLSPSPGMDVRKQSSSSPRHFSPLHRQLSTGRRSPLESYPRSPLRVIKSRSLSPITNRVCNRMLGSRSRCRSPSVETRSHRFSITPQYTPRLSRNRSITSTKGKKRKSKDKRKKGKKHVGGLSQSADRKIIEEYNRIDVEKISKKVGYGSRSRNIHSPVEKHDWSPSPSPLRSNEADFDFSHDKIVSWTPPMHSPQLSLTETAIPNYHPILSRSASQSSRKEKSKRNKKKKKADKHKELRKEKKRKKQTETPETATSKEVFASGNNILVSVSFNKDASGTSQQYIPQQTIVTLPPHREDLLTNKRTSADRLTNSSSITKKRTERRKKIDTKPVAIIDLERSPFQVQQELADIIVLTDSEDTHDVQCEHRREKRCSESCHKDSSDSHHILRDSVSGEEVQDDLDAMHETSYETPQTGPKTPPEPLLVKFNLQIKKQNKVRNPLHEDEDDDANCNDSLEEHSQQQSQQKDQLCSNVDAMHNQNPTKIGPNTPPESGPCSPDAYDPFEPTKSPSMSAHSPTPPKQNNDSQQLFGSELRDIQPPHMAKIEDQCREHIPCLSGSVSQNTTINPVDLVMALMNSKSTTTTIQDSNKSVDSQFNTSMVPMDSREETAHDVVEENSTITVLSNVLLSTTSAQHIPSISSPTSPATLQKKMLPISTKMNDNIGSNNGTNIRNGNSSNVDDSFNINDVESPYSPGSADYEDLFEPPPENINSSKRQRSKRSNINTSSQSEVFDNLFGSSSPVGHSRQPTYTPAKKNKTVPIQTRHKAKSKAAKVGEEHKLLDDIPNSAVELQVKDKFLRKLNRQERVVEEVKLVLKPRFNKKQITKEDYKEIMRRAVPKICHSKSGEIDPHKIKNLIDAYVKKFRAKHKKLNLVNTGQVSSAVKCAAYLKKL